MYRVLIIEDEPAYRDLLKKEFEKENTEVIVAPDGKVGLQQILYNSVIR